MTFPNVVFIRHKVINFRKWKAVFEAHGPARVAQGCLGAHIFRRADNPKELVVMLTWSDLARARQFLASDDLRIMLAEVPVSDGSPDVYLLEKLEETCLPTLKDLAPSASGEPSGGVMESDRSAAREPSVPVVGRGPLENPAWVG